jgi:hypothetical protein
MRFFMREPQAQIGEEFGLLNGERSAARHDAVLPRRVVFLVLALQERVVHPELLLFAGDAFAVLQAERAPRQGLLHGREPEQAL